MNRTLPSLLQISSPWRLPTPIGEPLARLEESELRARHVVDTAHDAFVGMNSDGQIVTWNAQAARTFGWESGEIVGKALSDTLIPPGFREGHRRGLRRFLESGEAPVVNQTLELTALHRKGQQFPMEITITNPIRSNHGFFLRGIHPRHIQLKATGTGTETGKGVCGGCNPRQERISCQHEP